MRINDPEKCRFLNFNWSRPLAFDMHKECEDEIEITDLWAVLKRYPPENYFFPKKGTISKEISSSNHWLSADIR